jgi:membrane protein DedA with SNARE-associated domain
VTFPLAQWIEQYGYLAVLAGALLEGETILVLGGFAAHEGHLDLATVLLVAFAGGTVGDQLFFWFGRASGPRLLQRYEALARAGERVGRLLIRHDAALIFGIRFMYGLRIAGPIAMGALGVVPRRFAIFNVLGAAVWAPLVGGAGYLFGRALQAWLGEVEHYESIALALIVGGAVVATLAHRWWQARERVREGLKSGRGAVAPFAVAVVLALGSAAFPLRVEARAALGAMGLRAYHTGLAAQLADSPFGGPLVLQSQEGGRRVEGDVYAVLDHPFTLVSTTLSDPGRWCDVLILHLNTKYCRRTAEGADTHIQMRVGKKEEQSLHTASLLDFTWRPPVAGPGYFVVQMEAGDGPYDTRDYQLLVEAVPLDAAHTFLHMGYAFSFGGASNLAMKLYLATIGHDKVGFSRDGDPAPGQAVHYVQGMRGVTERNTMRYYLAIDAYLGSLSAPAAEQPEKRFAAWFDATERYPRQLHEVDREAYLRMKRNEYRRQLAQP